MYVGTYAGTWSDGAELSGSPASWMTWLECQPEEDGTVEKRVSRQRADPDDVRDAGSLTKKAGAPTPTSLTSIDAMWSDAHAGSSRTDCR